MDGTMSKNLFTLMRAMYQFLVAAVTNGHVSSGRSRGDSVSSIFQLLLALGITCLVATSLQSLPVGTAFSYSGCIRSLCLSFIRMLEIGFMVHPDNPAYSFHLNVFIISTKTLFPYMVTFIGCRVQDQISLGSCHSAKYMSIYQKSVGFTVQV